MDDPVPPIPPGLFDSVEQDGPFHRCLRCRADFIETGRAYFISKEFARGDCVLEYAICDHCREEISVELSEESRASVQKLLEEDVDWEARLGRIHDANDISAWLGNCLFCNSLPDDNRGYGISGLFLNGRPLPGPFPAMICGNCAERIIETSLGIDVVDGTAAFNTFYQPGKHLPRSALDETTSALTQHLFDAAGPAHRLRHLSEELFP